MAPNSAPDASHPHWRLGTTSCVFGWEKIKLESFQLDLLI